MDKNGLIPEIHKKAWILGGIIGAIAAGFGWYWLGADHNFIPIAIMTAIGIIFGWIVAVVFNKKIALGSLMRVETKIDYVLAVVSFLLAIAGIIGFIRTGKAIGLVGALFFSVCGGYLIVKHTGD